MLNERLNKERDLLVALIRNEASRGVMSFNQIRDRFQISTNTLYAILNLQGRYKRYGGKPINVMSARTHKRIAVMQLLFPLKVSMAEIATYLGLDPVTCYIAYKRDTTVTAKVPVRVKDDFKDKDGRPQRAGHYWLTSLSEDELWATPIREKASGFVVAKTELIGRVSTIEGMNYE